MEQPCHKNRMLHSPDTIIEDHALFYSLLHNILITNISDCKQTCHENKMLHSLI